MHTNSSACIIIHLRQKQAFFTHTLDGYIRLIAVFIDQM